MRKTGAMQSGGVWSIWLVDMAMDLLPVTNDEDDTDADALLEWPWPNERRPRCARRPLDCSG